MDFRKLLVLFGVAMAAFAQARPVLLQVVRETIVVGNEGKYDEIERTLARLCAEKNCPNNYLAMATVDSPTEVWWINMYSSHEALTAVTAAYASRPDLIAEMTRLSDGKKGIVTPPVEVLYVPVRDKSRAARWALGDSPYAVVAETLDPTWVSFAFAAPGGKALRIEAAATRENANAIARRWGRGARILEMRPEWSRPDEAWAARNPTLWGR